MKIFLIATFYLFTSSFIFSQEIFRVDNMIFKNKLECKLTIEKYYNTDLYKNRKCNFQENTVEQKFCIFLNLNTKKDLVDFFNPYKIPSSYSKEEYLDKMKDYDNSSNFYHLDSKYTLDYGISKDIFIKYVNNNNLFPKPIYSAIYLQNFFGSLLIKDMGENFDFGLFLINSSTSEVINYLNYLKNKEINITMFCDDFLKNIKNGLTKSNLSKMVDKKYSPFFDEKKEFVQQNFSPATFSSNYMKIFHDIINGVVFKNKSVPRNEISEKYNIPLEKLMKDSLSVKEVINVNTMNNDYTIVKFYDHTPIIKVNFNLIDTSNIRNTVLYFLIQLDLNVFADLFFGKRTSFFTDLDKFDPKIRENGVINIRRLSDFFDKNKTIIEKYINDFNRSSKK